MKTLKENYQRALIKANQLPSHINGVLQDHYKFYGEDKKFSNILYVKDINVATVFEALNLRYSGAERYYVQTIPTYREDGNLEKMKNWNKKLMFHKAWSRTDDAIKKVKFDIIGIKRKTTHLPAGVLIANIRFIK